MLYRRHLLKELTLTASGVFFVLFLILLSTQIINLLGRISDGRVAFDAIGSMLVVWMIGLTPLLLILIVFITVLTVFSRYWRDSEMVVWLSSTLSIKQWISPLMTFVLPLTILTAVMSLWVAPWAESRGAMLAQFLKQKQDMSLVKEGVFQTHKGSESVYFVERFDVQKGIAQNVFVHGVDNDKKTFVITAQSGTLTEENGARVLSLKHGVRVSGYIGQADFDRISFEETRLIIAMNPKITTTLKRNTATTKQLWQSKDLRWRAELMWRLSMPMVVPILALLALALSYVNPRSMSSYNILFAVLIFFLYQSGLNLMRSSITNGRVNFWVGLFAVHIIMLLLACWLIMRRDGIRKIKQRQAA